MALPFQMGVIRPELVPDIRSSGFQNYVLFFRSIEDRLENINIVEGHGDIPYYFSVTNPE